VRGSRCNLEGSMTNRRR